MLTIQAPAKINLFLHIVGKQRNGYHLIQSAVFFTDIADRLTITKPLSGQRNKEQKDNLTIIGGEFAHLLPKQEDNIILRVISEIRKYYSKLPYIDIQLEKHLPVAAGLGGGSADAMAVARALFTMANCYPDERHLFSILKNIGADLPICYKSQPAFAEGMGEQIAIWPNDIDMGVLLVNPRISILTKDIFANVAANYRSPAKYLPPNNMSEFLELACNSHNDLQSIAITVEPIIKYVISQIEQLPNCLLARMSGSGASCFGLFANRQQAEIAAHELHRKHNKWWIKAGGIWNGS